MNTVSPKVQVESIEFKEREYEYSGRIKKRKRNAIRCPFCDKKVKQLSAGKKGKIIRPFGRRIYFIKNGGVLFNNLLLILDEKLAKNGLQKIVDNNGCKSCRENEPLDVLVPEDN